MLMHAGIPPEGRDLCVHGRVRTYAPIGRIHVHVAFVSSLYLGPLGPLAPLGPRMQHVARDVYNGTTIASTRGAVILGILFVIGPFGATPSGNFNPRNAASQHEVCPYGSMAWLLAHAILFWENEKPYNSGHLFESKTTTNILRNLLKWPIMFKKL